MGEHGAHRDPGEPGTDATATTGKTRNTRQPGRTRIAVGSLWQRSTGTLRAACQRHGLRSAEPALWLCLLLSLAFFAATRSADYLRRDLEDDEITSLRVYTAIPYDCSLASPPPDLLRLDVVALARGQSAVC